MVNAQEWLDENYPKENRGEVRKIYLNKVGLEGELDLSGFIYEWLRIYISPNVDETKLKIKNLLPEKAKTILTNSQKYLQQEYPNKEERKKVTELRINDRELEGELDLTDFINLKDLECSGNKLTSLNLGNCSQLKKIGCSGNRLTSLNVRSCSRLEKISCYRNFLTNLILPLDQINLQELDLRNNNFPSRDLSFLVSATSLKTLELGNSRNTQDIYNKFTGSLDYLSTIEQLKILDISNTDINEVNLDKLPKNLEEIKCSVLDRPNSELIQIIPQLEKYKYGLCQKCQQINTSYKWCQFCQEQEWKQLSGQELVEKFIQQQELRWKEENIKDYLLKWIPYKQFMNIEYLAEGGFGKVYKSKWKEIKKYYEFSTKEDVILKSLNNSQNINFDFLTEVANHKLVDMVHCIVNCYGISQDPKTKNYVIVMEYMKDGNLRHYLQQKGGELSFRDKLRCLNSIASGLDAIHQQNLVHRDFHLGNILSCDYDGDDDFDSCITDLGLSKLINSQSEEGKIYGVLPYVAPEVLRGKPYTQATDVYSFGIVAYELFANVYPYINLNGVDLALKICQGLRPNIDQVKIPQLCKDLIKRCWEMNPKKRLTTEELKRIISDWWNEFYHKENTEFTRQCQVTQTEYNNFSQNTPYQIHQTAVLTSKPINTKKITELLENSKRNNVSRSLEFNLEELDHNLKKQEKETESNQNNSDWTNICSGFTPELFQQWQNLRFAAEQCRDWINTTSLSYQEQAIQESAYYAWLRDIKRVNTEWLLNHGQEQDLKKEYREYQQPQQEQLQAQVQIPPKRN